MFNFGVVVEEGSDRGAFERVVRRLAVTFGEMEVQDGYLSSQEGKEGGIGNEGKAVGRDGRRGVEGLLEIVREDLNNYGECMIPVGESCPPALTHALHHVNLPAGYTGQDY